MADEEQVVEGERSPREMLAEFARANEEEIKAALMSAMKAEKKVSVSIACKHCSREGFYTVDVPDSKATATFVSALLDQSYGRPATESGPAEQQTVVSYTVLCRDEEAEQAIRDEFMAVLERAGSLGEAREAAAALGHGGARKLSETPTTVG